MTAHPINLTPEQEIAAAHERLDTFYVDRYDRHTGAELNLLARIWAFADKQGLVTESSNPHVI